MFSRTANGCGHRQIAMCPARPRRRAIADKTALKMMREMGISCGIRRETRLPQVQLVTRASSAGRSRTSSDRDFAAGRTRGRSWARTSPSSRRPWRQGLLCPGVRLRQQGDRGLRAYRGHARTWRSRSEMLDRPAGQDAGGRQPGHALGHGTGSTSTPVTCQTLEEAGIVQSMSRKGNCIDNGATEQVFGHIKDEFFRGRELRETFEEFKASLEAYIVHWNTRRRQVKLKGLPCRGPRDCSAISVRSPRSCGGSRRSSRHEGRPRRHASRVLARSMTVPGTSTRPVGRAGSFARASTRTSTSPATRAVSWATVVTPPKSTRFQA